MPTILTLNGYRFFFFSDEHAPCHVHVEKGSGYMRVELDSLKITDAYKLSPKEIKNIITIVKENQFIFKKAWDEYFH